MGCVNGTTRSAVKYYHDPNESSMVVDDDDIVKDKKRNNKNSTNSYNINTNSSELSLDERTKKGKKKKTTKSAFQSNYSSLKNANMDGSGFIGTKLAAANDGE